MAGADPASTFARLDPWLAAYLERLTPAERRRIARKIGMDLRKANAKRITANVQPDGSPMPARKLKKGKGALRRARMFRKLRLNRNIKVKPNGDGVSVGFEGTTAHTARVHQYGLYDFVGRTKSGKTVRGKYPRRVLLGFGPDDMDLITDTALAMLEG